MSRFFYVFVFYFNRLPIKQIFASKKAAAQTRALETIHGKASMGTSAIHRADKRQRRIEEELVVALCGERVIRKCLDHPLLEVQAQAGKSNAQPDIFIGQSLIETECIERTRPLFTMSGASVLTNFLPRYEDAVPHSGFLPADGGRLVDHQNIIPSATRACLKPDLCGERGLERKGCFAKAP